MKITFAVAATLLAIASPQLAFAGDAEKPAAKKPAKKGEKAPEKAPEKKAEPAAGGGW